MIEEQFVSFETARLLKEAGFDAPCRGVYVTDRTGYYEFREYDNKQTKDDLLWNIEDGFQYEYLAPTQALAARWLREVHHLNVYACFDYVCFDDGERKWFFMRENTMINDYTSVYCSIISYDSYEQALEAGLQEAVKLIKKQGL